MNLTFALRSTAIFGFVCSLGQSEASAQIFHRNSCRSAYSYSQPANIGQGRVQSGGQPAVAPYADSSIDRPQQDFAATTVDQEIQFAVRNDPLLRGAWLELLLVEPAAEGSASNIYRFKRVLDRSRAAEQIAAMDRLIATWVPASSRIVFSDPYQTYPLTELLISLQERIELDFRFSGCLIEDGYYAADENDDKSLNLMLRGRIANADQRDLLQGECSILMKSNPAWVGSPAAKVQQVSFKSDGSSDLSDVSLVIVPMTREADLKVIPAAHNVAVKWYLVGLKHFKDGRYADASRAFQLAVIEAPDLLEYRYWRVISELAQGRTERAYRHMRIAVKNPNVQQYSVNKVMERVQGPLRQELRQLEQRVMFTRTRGDY